MERRDEAATIEKGGAVAQTFAYDSAGRQIEHNDLTLHYNDLDQLTRVSGLGSNGNQAVQHDYGYEGQRLRTKHPDGSVEYWFGPDVGQRRGKRIYHIRRGDRLVARLSRPIGQTAVTETTYFHGGLAMGPVLFTDASGKVQAQRRYEPFGAGIDQSGASGTTGPVDFSDLDYNSLNKPTDPSTNFSYHGARWLGLDTARWTTPDPPVKGPGKEFAATPWTLHPYQYVSQSPTLYWDPDGRRQRPTDGGVPLPAGPGTTYWRGPTGHGAALLSQMAHHAKAAVGLAAVGVAVAAVSAINPVAALAAAAVFQPDHDTGHLSDALAIAGPLAISGRLAKSLAAAGREGRLLGAATRGGGGGRTLFRAVGPKELSDIRATGRYRVPEGGTDGKYLFETPEQASSFARMMGDQPYTTNSVRVTPAELGRGQRITPAREGPAYFFDTPDVPSGPVNIHNYSVVP